MTKSKETFPLMVNSILTGNVHKKDTKVRRFSHCCQVACLRLP